MECFSILCIFAKMRVHAMTKVKPTFVYSLIALLFLITAGFGFMVPMTMDGHHHEPGCPFMPGEQSICMMTPLDHIAAWQSTFTTLVPDAVKLVLLALCFVAILPQLFRPPDKLRRSLITVFTLDLPPPLYQQLFSQGILNPKAP